MSNQKNAPRMQEFLQETAKALCAWLEERLPHLVEDWWNQRVIPCFSHQQRGHVERNGIDSLSRLDLACLLRILDSNWHELARIARLDTADRNYVKEMQTVRNRWAHVDVTEPPIEDVYRDADTVLRVMELLGAPDKAVFAVRDFRAEVMAGGLSGLSAELKGEVSIAPAFLPEGSPYGPGTEVCLRSDPDRRGVVVAAVNTDGPEPQYIVFLDNKKQPFYESQLCLPEPEDGPDTVRIETARTMLTALQILHPSTATLYSLNAARIEFVPYQFRPALKIIRSDRPRILVADGVGVGKTIEAGLILRELQARSDIRSVLIVCPKPLVAERKWELEMRRFDEQFTPLSGAELRICVDETDATGIWPEQHSKVIIPYSLFDETLIYGGKRAKRKVKGLLDLDPPPRFDLIIVDEAQHIRNASTLAHQAVSFLCGHAGAVVFLTATPIMLGNADLFTLLNVLRPDIVIDGEAFNHMAEPNPHINRAARAARSADPDWQEAAREALDEAANTSWGRALLRENPEFVEVCATLDAGVNEREDRVSLVRKIEEFHSFSGIINRTRRRDIGDFCKRNPQTVEVAFTPAQRALYDRLMLFQEEMLGERHGTQNVQFMMTTIRRQAASCLFGLSAHIGDLLARRLRELDAAVLDEEGDLDAAMPEEMASRAREIAHMAETLAPEDPKFDALADILRQKQALPNNKLIVFSTFRHTLGYLERRLKETKVRAGLVHGGVGDEERQEIRRRFELPREAPDALDVLLFSEVGCEGLDYQFCDAMVNYDLPWNPMRIEQRIGRIDRRGQKSEAVAIYNLITRDTIDAEIYYRCLWRIGVFEASIGDCEEILGDITRGIRDIADNLALSEKDRRRKLEQLADNEIRLLEEQRTLEEHQHEFFALQTPRGGPDEDVMGAESLWLSQAALGALVLRYLQERVGPGEYLLGQGPVKTLRINAQGRALLQKDFEALQTVKSPLNLHWDRWLGGDDPHVSVTFDGAAAADTPSAQFIMPLHPLVRQAAQTLSPKGETRVHVRVSAAHLPPGRHPFAVYAWDYRGLRKELALIPVCAEEAVREELFALLESAVPAEDSPQPADQSLFETLEHTHHRLWQQALEQHRVRTEKACRYRRQSLDTSHNAQMRVLKEQLATAANEKIIRMRTAHRENLQRSHQDKVRDIARAAETADILFQKVLVGTITVAEESI